LSSLLSCVDSSPCVYNLAAILRKKLNGGSAIVRMGENGQLNRQFCVCINNQSLALQLLYSCFFFSFAANALLHHESTDSVMFCSIWAVMYQNQYKPVLLLT
jgi:hypothetical protein